MVWVALCKWVTHLKVALSNSQHKENSYALSSSLHPSRNIVWVALQRTLIWVLSCSPPKMGSSFGYSIGPCFCPLKQGGAGILGLCSLMSMLLDSLRNALEALQISLK
jgi:hypothetical protein